MSDPAATTPTSASSNGSGSERVSVAAFVNRGRLDAALCGLRLCGLLCMLAFYLMGPAFYYLGLRAMLAAYVLRLYQRVGAPRLSTVFLQQALTEDAGQYIFFILICMFFAPLGTVAVAFIVSAGLGVAAYLDRFIAATQSLQMIRPLTNRVLASTGKGLELIVMCEIAALAETIFVSIMRMSLQGLLVAWIMVQFHQMRCLSRRNDYPRRVWRAFNARAAAIFHHPRCPAMLTRIYEGVVARMTRMMPQAQAQAQ